GHPGPPVTRKSVTGRMKRAATRRRVATPTMRAEVIFHFILNLLWFYWEVSCMINPANSLFWALWPKNISDLPEAKLKPDQICEAAQSMGCKPIYITHWPRLGATREIYSGIRFRVTAETKRRMQG
ncbi:MAG: hypothetical protein R6U55_07785, partial [Desulfovermiculus sp.]